MQKLCLESLVDNWKQKLRKISEVNILYNMFMKVKMEAPYFKLSQGPDSFETAPKLVICLKNAKTKGCEKLNSFVFLCI